MTPTTTLSVLSLVAATGAPAPQATSIPSVVVRVENAQPELGTFLTPPWIAIHDGTFDSYDGGMPANVPLGGNEIEALAEDGNNGPISATFASLLPNAPQVTALTGPVGPLAPGSFATVTLNVDPTVDRYFSYASMVIPSNDAFIANGNPVAHELFDGSGNFVGQGFVVSGDETNDAGTEVNDEVSQNVAFLGQAGPNIGVTENGLVLTPSPGFASAGSLAFPDGVLNHPAFSNGDFNDEDDRLFAVSFRYVDLGGPVRFLSNLTNAQEVQADVVSTGATGTGLLFANNGTGVNLNVFQTGLSGPITAAHLHLGQRGTNGDVIVDLGAGIVANGAAVRFQIDASSLTGPLDGADFVEFLNELAAGNVYINLHTDLFPEGELRGQVALAN